MGLTQSQEDYLEAIHQIVVEKGEARVKEIAEEVGVKAPSVTGALRNLAEKSLVNYTPYGAVTLTPAGAEIAREIARRHRTIRLFLEDVLCVSTDEAKSTACRMEHVVSREVMQRLVEYLEFTNHCASERPRWSQDLGFYCVNHGRSAACSKCKNHKGTKDGSPPARERLVHCPAPDFATT